MGYDTTFTGEFNLDKPLDPRHKAYLDAFANTRRVTRDPVVNATMMDAIRVAAGLSYKPEYYVGSATDGDFGQSSTPDIIDGNRPPEGQPSLWCDWAPNEDGTAIVWTESEKFYQYIEWITYLVENFLRPWGYVLNGMVSWQGEEPGDVGVIELRNNEVNPEKKTSPVTKDAPSSDNRGGVFNFNVTVTHNLRRIELEV